eukprot:TRINITY_DN46219_c0_g1_i1.p1 TRINITY_DN46219_c0_g1~~TRINITY_DN46219_c0_g1_i1.p1  ORF type:complete len:184 (+),score=43.41 TRINITY_DN46219_c0_g1_i1:126-677(+)
MCIRDRSQVELAKQVIIYVCDLGLFIPSANYTVVCLDEPLDGGCAVELMRANALDKPVIGWRSDVSTPFGTLKGPTGGAHWFPMFHTDAVVWAMPGVVKTVEDADKMINETATKLHEAIASTPTRGDVSHTDSLVAAADLLFAGLDIRNVGDPANIPQVVQAYVTHHQQLMQLLPTGVPKTPF